MQLFVNNWSSQLTAALTTAAVQLSVDPDQAAKLVGLGDGDYYVLTLVAVDGNGVEVAWEIIEVTGVAGGVLDIGRGQEGTIPLAFAVGAFVSARLTAGTISAIAAAMQPTPVVAQGFWPYYLNKADQDKDNSNTSLPTLRYGSLINLEVAGSDVSGVNVYRMIPERDLLINRMTYSAFVTGGTATEDDLICGVVYDSDSNGMPGGLLAKTSAENLMQQRTGGVFAGGAQILLEAGKPYWLGTHSEIATPGLQLTITTVDKAGENLSWYIYGLYSYDAIWADMGAIPGSTPASWASKVDESPVNLQYIPVVGIGEKIT